MWEKYRKIYKWRCEFYGCALKTSQLIEKPHEINEEVLNVFLKTYLLIWKKFNW